MARDHGRHFMGAELDAKYHGVAMRRLSGEPDENNCFPNLKTLRNYVERTGQSPSKFRFDVQVGSKATDRTHSKRSTEEDLLTEFEVRLGYEEEAFAADLRGTEHPVGHGMNGKKQKPEPPFD